MLKQIFSILESNNIEASIVKTTSPDIIHERLMVFLGIDSKNREQILEITTQEQILTPEKTQPHTSSQKDYYRIQFLYKFPFDCKDEALNQAGNLLHFLNQTADFPGLELNELENKISFRYVWLTKTEAIDSFIIVSLIGVIQLIVALFSESIEKVASGEKSYNELLQEVISLVAKAQRSISGDETNS